MVQSSNHLSIRVKNIRYEKWLLGTFYIARKIGKLKATTNYFFFSKYLMSLAVEMNCSEDFRIPK